MAAKKEKIFIFDTTLRDGEQCPGASMNAQQKLEVARQLQRLKVDVIEAGFPISSPGDWEAVNTIARLVKGPSIAGLCRAVKKDIESAASALKPCKNRTIHTFIATSDIHLKHKLRKSRAEVLKQAVESVRLAKSLAPNVEFSAEDASRSDPEYLAKVVQAVIDAGATVVNLPDTVGYASPETFAAFIETVMKLAPNSHKARFSVHNHNDLGLAVANSLAAIKVGVRQVECTINGIGERAGNCSLEEVVMAVKTRKDVYKVTTDVVTRELTRASRLVSNFTGMVVQPNKAIVGANAFAHESGIHQDGILKKRQTYEIMNPKDVGLAENQLVLGRRSGRHAIKKRLEYLGAKLAEKDMDRIYQAFVELADRKKEVLDDDLIALVDQERVRAQDRFTLKSLQVNSGTDIKPTCVVALVDVGGKKEKTLNSTVAGNGPVDAIYHALDEMTGTKYELESYSIKAITGGTDAQGEVTVVLKSKGQKVSAHGAHTDVLVASALAYLGAINKMLRLKKRKAMGPVQGI